MQGFCLYIGLLVINKIGKKINSGVRIKHIDVDKMNEEEYEGEIEIDTKNKPLPKIGEELEEKKKKKPNAKVSFNNYPSRWDRSPGLRGAMKIARALGAEVDISDNQTSDPFDKFKKTLEEMGFEKTGYIDLLGKMAALQPCGVLFDPYYRVPTVTKQNTPSLGGYPEEAIKEVLDEDDLKRITYLVDSDVVKKNEGCYSFTKRGENIVAGYIESELEPQIDDIVDELADRIGLRLPFAYFHAETLGEIKKDKPIDKIGTSIEHTLPNRAMEYSVFSMDSIVGRAINSETKYSNFTEEDWKKDEGRVIPKLRQIWDILEDSSLAMNAPKIDTEILITPKHPKNIQEVEQIKGTYEITEDYQRCIPVKLADELFDMIAERLSMEKKVISILMLVSKYRDSPKQVKKKLKREDHDYDLSKEDESLLENVIHSLSNKGITSEYSQTGDTFIVRDKSALDEFLRDYLLGKENIEL